MSQRIKCIEAYFHPPNRKRVTQINKKMMALTKEISRQVFVIKDLFCQLIAINSKIEGETIEFNQYILRLEQMIQTYIQLIQNHVNQMATNLVLVSVLRC